MKNITIKSITALICCICILCSIVGCTDTNVATTESQGNINVPSTTLTTTTLTPDTTTFSPESTGANETAKAPETTKPLTLADIPSYSGQAYTVLSDNRPQFTSDDFTTASYERYGELDSLGRCTQVYACIGRDLMPTEERGSIGSVKPSGWQTVKYDCVDGKYLYNRCHLIGWQLTGENANTKNLITGTRYLNIEGMLPFENMVADYVKESGNHVLYRVTPMFDGDDLVAKGVLMEGYSIEDKGEGICFCIFAYNVQPQIKINYKDGSSELVTEEQITKAQTETKAPEIEYTLNTNTKKFHYPSCSSAKKIDEENKRTYTGNRDELISDGYSPCGNCKP